MKEKYRDLSKNVIIFAISSFGINFISFLLVPLYTNKLSTSDYGIVENLVSISSLAIYIFTISIADSVLRFSYNTNETENILSYGIKIVKLGGAIICTGILLFQVFSVMKFPGYYYIFIIFYFCFTALYQILINYMKAVDETLNVAIAGIIMALVIIFCNIISLVLLKIGFVGYLFSYVIGSFVAVLYAIISCKIPLKVFIKDSCSKETSILMIGYSIPLVFNKIAVWINGFLDRIFITKLLGVGENGIYSIASKIPSILAVCFTVFSQAWNISVIKEYEGENESDFFVKIYDLYNMFVVLCCSMLVIMNIPLAKLLFQKDFFSAWQYSSVLLISSMFNGFTLFLSGFFIASKKTKVIAVSTIFAAVANTALNIILIPRFGTMGAAIATVFSFVIMWAVRVFYIKYAFQLRLNLLRNLIAYTMIAVQVVLEHVGNHFYLIQFVLLGCLCYIYKNQIGDFFVMSFNVIKKHRRKE